ncbi:uncharacterized protein [Musca autumnalis]|uniref:uncharacterized protein n=1 Tax=Musca autumnalis TaxID=221902 RepID=UPI003CEA1A97
MPMYCAVADHLLVDGCFVENPHHIKFIRKNFIDFRPRSQICRTCKAAMEYSYELAIKRLKKKRRMESIREELSSVSSLETLRRSRSLSIQSNITNDTIDEMVAKTPAHQSLQRSSTSLTNGSRVVNRLDVESTPYIRSKLVSFESPKRVSKEITTAAAHSPNVLAELNTTERNVFTPTIYTEETPVAVAPTAARRLMGRDANNTMDNNTTNPAVIARRNMGQDTNSNNSTNNIRRSQEPTTSKAAAEDASRKQIQEKTKGITKYFQPTSKTASKANNVEPLHGKTPTTSAHLPSSQSNVRLSQEPTTSRAATNIEPLYGTTPTDNSEEPNTSASIIVTPTTTNRKKRVLHVTDDDDESVEDDEQMLSLHAFDGTRLPNVQPIIKRSKQQFTHPDYRVMDIYIADTSGG